VQEETTDTYFLDSANNVSCFFEEKAFDEEKKLRQAKSKSINKIGHGKFFVFYNTFSVFYNRFSVFYNTQYTHPSAQGLLHSLCVDLGLSRKVGQGVVFALSLNHSRCSKTIFIIFM
jgi:hypothetical protein